MEFFPEWFFLLVAVLFGVAAIRELILALAFKRSGKRALGLVVRLETDYDNGTPIIEYETERGERREFRLTTRYWGESFEVGERVPVLYDPQHLKRVVVDRVTHRWAGTVLWVVLGGVVLGVMYLTNIF